MKFFSKIRAGVNMVRRFILGLLALVIAVVVVHASDFWAGKNWKEWSKGECEALLAESPWAHIWRGGGPQGDQLAYAVQLRSALPVREAIVRQLQIDQKYDHMTGAQRTAFDTRAEQILSRAYDDVILVHVDFSKGIAARYLQGVINSFHTDADTFSASIATEDGNRVAPIRVDIKTDYSFDLIFPRAKNGMPEIKEGQRHFSVQFQSPQFTNPNQSITVPNKLIAVEFDLGKMDSGGKPDY
jgi:hypothetical protein